MKLFSFFSLPIYMVLLAIASGGTTIVAKCSDGIVLASDSLHTIGQSPLVSAQSIRKFHLLTPSIAIGYIAGGWEFHQLYKQLQLVLREHEFTTGEEMSITAIKHFARRLIYEKYSSVHIIVAGYDIGVRSDEDTAYRIYEILPQGTLVEQDFIVCGSGGNFLLPILEQKYKSGKDIVATGSKLNTNVEDMLEVCKNGLQSVSKLDHKTGGSKSTFWIMK